MYSRIKHTCYKIYVQTVAEAEGLKVSGKALKSISSQANIYEGESTSNQPYLFPVEIQPYVFDVIAL